MSDDDDKAAEAEAELRRELAKEAAKVKPDPGALAKIRKRSGGSRRGNGKSKK